MNKIITFFLKVKKIFKANQSINWKDNEYFDSEWKNRIKLMAGYVSDYESVIDLGCGEMWLKDYLKDNAYYPVDYTKRNAFTIVCDFNKKQFPEINTDVAFVSGCLEYIEDVEWFVKKISEYNKTCILSYCVTEYFPIIENRKGLAWKNHLSRQEIISLFERNTFFLTDTNLTKTNNEIFIFKK